MSNPNNTNHGNLYSMTHARVALKKAQVHAAHPFKSVKNHETLLTYLQQRLQLGKNRRDGELARFAQVDRDVAGWMRTTDEDKERIRKQTTTGIPQATMMNLPLSYVHLDDMMTYFAATFSPNRGMFYHTGKPGEVQQGAQITTIMNNHAIHGGYFRETLMAIYSLLKYNRGGFHVFWGKDTGPKIVQTDEKTTQVVQELKWQGNKLSSIDMYNFLYDPQVHPTKLHTDGEFAAVVEMKSYYWLQNQAAQGMYFNCEQALIEHEGQGVTTYYRNPPAEAKLATSDGRDNDWVGILSENEYSGTGGGLEITTIHIKLNPTEFGLVEGNAQVKEARNRYETWRFTILNDKYIIDATYMNNIHGMLPYFLGVLNDDLMGASQKSTAEILSSLQNFASFLLNTHVLATRKNIWGKTFYDPSMIDMASIPDGSVAANIPIKSAAQGKDIRTMIYHDNNLLDTKQTMQDLESVMGIINQFYPTQSLPNQIANIDRAVSSQVAAVQQGANRRQQKAARLLDDTLFRNMRFAMYYNILQYQPSDTEVTDFYTGKPVKIDLGALRDTDLPFIIGQGLKAIDRQAAAERLQQIIFAFIQAPQSAAEIDLLGLIDYWVSMIDIDVDMTQFRKALPPAPAEGGGTGTAEVDAAGNPIQPATNPASLTAPIFG